MLGETLDQNLQSPVWVVIFMIDCFLHFSLHQISPPPMTSASYWGFKAVCLALQRVAVPAAVRALRPRSVHTAAAMAGV